MGVTATEVSNVDLKFAEWKTFDLTFDSTTATVEVDTGLNHIYQWFIGDMFGTLTGHGAGAGRLELDETVTAGGYVDMGTATTVTVNRLEGDDATTLGEERFRVTFVGKSAV